MNELAFILFALSVPPLGQVLGVGLGHVGFMFGLLGASWGALGHFACVFERVWGSLAPFGRFGVGFLVYFLSNFR